MYVYMSFLHQFSWNSHCPTSLCTNSYTKFHLNWTINVECKDRNLFMHLSRVLFSLHMFPQNSCSLSRFLYISLVPNHFTTWAKDVENRAKIMCTPISKVWHLLHHHSQNSHLRSGMTLRSPLPKFSQISQKMWEVLLELYLCRQVKCDYYWTNFDRTLAQGHVVNYLLAKFDANLMECFDIDTRSQAHERGLHLSGLIFWPHKERLKWTTRGDNICMLCKA